jgi:hypothetical protein
MRCTPTIRELIEATPLSPSSPSAASLSALAPAQRAGAQRLCALALFGHRCDADEGPLLEAKRTCHLPTCGEASELLVPRDWELREEVIELESGRLVVEISAHLAEAILVLEGHQRYLRPKIA